MRYKLLLLIMLCYACQEKYDLPQTLILNENWQFKKVRDTVWNTALVPGNIHLDLLRHQQIEDPFILSNEELVQWVSETDWEYKTTFFLDEETLLKEHIELHFEGIDTYASVYLNDSLIFNTNNAFRAWNIDVKKLMRSENELRLHFELTLKYEALEKAKLSYDLPEGDRVFTRKAQFQYGWDWAPKLNTMGVWKPITLSSWNDLKIRRFSIIPNQLNDSLAELIIDTKIEQYFKDEELSFEIFVNDSLVLKQEQNSLELSSKFPIEIKNPKRWWPHNIGEPYLYDIKLKVKNGRNVLDSTSLKYGIRTTELITQKDSFGESFFFKINGIPVYAKGANYVPQNSFQNAVQDEDYEELLNSVLEANMNMLRVWGGGNYENDIFYELCDKKGIMVWQDFMFACAMYPGDEPFLKNVEQEVIDNIIRLRDRASVVLWCGNNESAEGWQNWGWQANRTSPEKKEIWNNYLKLFDSILPNVVSDYALNVPYWESSPKFGRGNPKFQFEGDAHDWWVWHDTYPFEHFENNVPRFMSEFGFQSFPSVEVLKYITQSDTLDLTSEAIKNHQKHLRGFQLMEEYMKRDFLVPDRPEDYVYMSQLVQAYGITKGIEAHRRAKPYNMGSLYWQLNDCWPGISWSSIDFFGNWKALHFKAKRSFENVLLSSKIKDNVLKTYLINDHGHSINGQFSIKILDFFGTIVWEDSLRISAAANSNNLIHNFNYKEYSITQDEVFALMEFNGEKGVYFFSKPKNLKLPKAAIEKSIEKINSGFKIELTSRTLQKDVYLFCNEIGQFSDNYFDLLPNETKTIVFNTSVESISEIKYITFNSFIR